MTVCICTAFDTGFASLAEITLPVLVRYCARHGYALRTLMNPPGDIYWERTRAMLDAINTYDIAVWMDTDSLVTNHAHCVESFIPDDKEACVSRDRNGINDGVFMVRGRGDGRALIHGILRLRGQPGVHAPQDALQRIHDEGYTSALNVVPNKQFNAFPPGSEGDTWEPGDFLLQMPGINRERRIEIAQATIPQIVWE